MGREGCNFDVSTISETHWGARRRNVVAVVLLVGTTTTEYIATKAGKQQIKIDPPETATAKTNARKTSTGGIR